MSDRSPSLSGARCETSVLPGAHTNISEGPKEFSRRTTAIAGVTSTRSATTTLDASVSSNSTSDRFPHRLERNLEMWTAKPIRFGEWSSPTFQKHPYSRASIVAFVEARNKKSPNHMYETLVQLECSGASETIRSHASRAKSNLTAIQAYWRKLARTAFLATALESVDFVTENDVLRHTDTPRYCSRQPMDGLSSMHSDDRASAQSCARGAGESIQPTTSRTGANVESRLQQRRQMYGVSDPETPALPSLDYAPDLQPTSQHYARPQGQYPGASPVAGPLQPASEPSAYLPDLQPPFQHHMPQSQYPDASPVLHQAGGASAHLPDLQPPFQHYARPQSQYPGASPVVEPLQPASEPSAYLPDLQPTFQHYARSQPQYQSASHRGEKRSRASQSDEEPYRKERPKDVRRTRRMEVDSAGKSNRTNGSDLNQQDPPRTPKGSGKGEIVTLSDARKAESPDVGAHLEARPAKMYHTVKPVQYAHFAENIGR
ncbi:MAG: hypothetical protein M1831_006710 [Alyxoria varia]|nr:MAG: hypothetical protein M1831_006710 [Alyxoria varia]